MGFGENVDVERSGFFGFLFEFETHLIHLDGTIEEYYIICDLLGLLRINFELRSRKNEHNRPYGNKEL